LTSLSCKDRWRRLRILFGEAESEDEVVRLNWTDLVVGRGWDEALGTVGDWTGEPARGVLRPRVEIVS